ncbi:MAG: two-component system sensor histidine kinase NtrB, partial [Thermodesulfovibrionales bacterium]
VGLAPLDVKMCIISSFIIYAIYLIPILSYDTISNKPFFIAANVFILSNVAAIILLRYLINKRFVSEFGLQYDIEQQKEQLEQYSHHLEDLVAERTKDLTIANKKYVALFDNSNDGVAIMDKNGIILDVNKRFCELHGFDKNALIGTHFRILEAKENEKVVEQRMERIIKGESLIFEAEHYRKDGTKIFLEVSSRAIEIMGKLYIQSLYRDITERKALQRQLLQAQKMESIGVLSGGLAHDFRNLLTVIHGYSEMIQHLENDITTKKYASGIEGATRKAEQMVTSLLQFAKQSAGEITTLNINDIVDNVLNLVTPMMLKANIIVERNLTESLPSIKGDANLLEQVIMNLMINAKDAMPDGGRLRVETSITEVNERNIVHPLLSHGEHILLRISDTGTGIPEDTKDRIFEPFFTTKGAKGTGLGLAMAYGTIRAHGGIIKVNSEVGKGSSFEIYLPLRAESKIALKESEEKKVGIIALIKDAELISRIKNTLEPKGYRIFHSDNTLYCLDIVSELSDSIAMVMVEISFMDSNFLARLKNAKSDIKIIIISDSDVPVRLIENENVKATLKLPFNDSLLLSAVQSISCLNETLKYERPQDLNSL